MDIVMRRCRIVLLRIVLLLVVCRVRMMITVGHTRYRSNCIVTGILIRYGLGFAVTFGCKLNNG